MHTFSHQWGNSAESPVRRTETRMHIIIPIGGIGKRFQDAGYVAPKPLISVFHKPMISHVLDSIKCKAEDHITIVYHQRLNRHQFCEIVQKHLSPLQRVRFVEIEKDTRGAVETVMMGLDKIRLEDRGKDNENMLHEPLIIMDCDTFYTCDVLGMYRSLAVSTHACFYMPNTDPQPIFSYLELENKSEQTSEQKSEKKPAEDMNRRVVSIREKVKISNCANTGAYAFASVSSFYDVATRLVNEDSVRQDEIEKHTELYISTVIDRMIQGGNNHWYGIPLDPAHVHMVGTPQQLKRYISNASLLLFDLDGTLIHTDELYLQVWTELLREYHITMTPELFATHIQGKSDINVLRQMIPNAPNIDFADFQRRKDELFFKLIGSCGNLNRAETYVSDEKTLVSSKLSHAPVTIIPGAREWIQHMHDQGHRCCIVTNCNRPVAEALVKYMHLESYIDFIVVGNECSHAKPHSAPYAEALRRYGQSDGSKAIIFEDSKPGLVSANGVSPHLLVRVDYQHKPQLSTSEEKQQTPNQKQLSFHDQKLSDWSGYDIDMTIHDYRLMNADFGLVQSMHSKKQKQIQQWIVDSLDDLDVKEIRPVQESVKGGFISDVMSMRLTTNQKGILNCVAKMENRNDTTVNRMAHELDLFQREYYFYETISKHVPIAVPQCYGLIKDEHFQNMGILMDDLSVRGYELNLNLNNSPISVSLSVIDALCRLHAAFWNVNLQQPFPLLKKNTDRKNWKEFVATRWDAFQAKWSKCLTQHQMEKGKWIVDHFETIEKELSDTHLTLCHGDVKSPNLFYRFLHDGQYEPIFIDWQYVGIGKGVQDLVFFLIESFTTEKAQRYHVLFKEYYYAKLVELSVTNYPRQMYDRDFKNAICYFPFFVAMWFGTLNDDELLDSNFAYFFIQRLFSMISLYV